MPDDSARAGGGAQRATDDDTVVLPAMPGGADAFDEPAPLTSRTDRTSPNPASVDDDGDDDADSAATSGTDDDLDIQTDDAEPTAGHRRPVGWMVTSGLLLIVAGVFIALTIHLTDVASQWQVRADELVEVNYDLGEDLVAEQETVLTQQEQIDLLNDQLSTLQQRVLDLADVVNQSDDNVATAQQQIDQLRDIVETGALVSNALNRCVDAQDQLAEYLREAEEYDEEELADFEDSVDERCTAAVEANSEYQASLTP